MLPSLSIIIVNYNTADLLPACLDSIIKQKKEVESIIVIDNNSTDKSIEVLEKYQPHIHLIVNEKNVGFGAANNLAAQHSFAELLFLLNPDTILHESCLETIRKYMAAQMEVGLAGVQIFNENNTEHDSIESAYPGNNYIKGLLRELPGTIAWVLGAGMVIRKKIFDQINGFDEDFFLYGEDIDICLRVRQQGCTIGFIKHAGIIHFEGQSERLTEPEEVVGKKLRAELLFYDKHYPISCVKKIKRARIIQAMWRVVSLRLSLLLSGRASREKTYKLMKYETTLKVYSLPKQT